MQVKLIKIGGRLVRHARRPVFHLAEVAVPRALFPGVRETTSAGYARRLASGRRPLPGGGVGVNIYSGTARGSLTDAGEAEAGFGYAAIPGTSMATPHVAGLAALLKHRDPGVTATAFKQAGRFRGGPFNHDTGWGFPRWSWFV